MQRLAQPAHTYGFCAGHWDKANGKFEEATGSGPGICGPKLVAAISADPHR